ncbi:Lrriq3 [Phodopus roborovskii]|uniref:Lrriq3 protein n=1 Tax=Phodopus roborovskii TaxID=109678 RepID=A0AAU9YRZ0_PHORO|nr:Lrriq3 [Phodopus roborovskii]
MFHGTITKELTSHEEWSHYNENIIEDQKDFVFVKYNGLHLKSMENLQSCISLRVCIFSNNFVTDIQPLQNCIKLIKLDLHGNQIKTLPDQNFWGGLKNLKLLYLHDNGFSKLKNICVLAACASLIGLTMFDCPVSLKKGYRHVLVNSIWPLKALDHHIISDEEIIQNWNLPERFKTFNHRLFFNLCPALIKLNTFGFGNYFLIIKTWGSIKPCGDRRDNQEKQMKSLPFPVQCSYTDCRYSRSLKLLTLHTNDKGRREGKEGKSNINMNFHPVPLRFCFAF